ncbi:hypothetical protein ACI8AK_14965 [Geodermatophilus sp. SYSU D00867]
MTTDPSERGARSSTGPPKRKIDFGDRVEWGAYAQPAMAMWARSPDLSPMAVRVLFAAMGRHDQTGHAPFRVRELADVLSVADKGTGQLVAARPDSVSKAVRSAKELGYIANESTARCLVLSPRLFQKASGRRTTCGVHD